MSVAATQRQRGVGRRAGERGDAVEPRLVDAGGGERLGEAPRLGDAEVLEAVEDLVLGVGGVERADRARARRRARPPARAARRASPPGALDARTRRSGDRPAHDLERLDHLRRGALRGGGGVVELVREAGGELAERGEPLAVLLDRGDPAHHRRDLAHDAVVHARMGEGEAAEVVGLDARELAVLSAPHPDAEPAAGEHADRAHPRRRVVQAGGLDPAVLDESAWARPENSSSTPFGVTPFSAMISPAATENGSATARPSASASSSRSSKRSIARRSAGVVVWVMRRPGTGG